MPESERVFVDQEGNNVNCLNSRAVIEYVRRKNPQGLGELFDGLPSPWREMDAREDYLSNENNWIPSSLLVGLFKKARTITGNPDVAFDVGFDSIIHGEFGYWQKIFLSIFLTPQTVLRRANQLNSKLNSTKAIEPVSSAPGRAVIRWHWGERVVASKDICSYNKGIYSALPTLLRLPAGVVEERSCRFEGDPYCEITLTWNKAWWRSGTFFSQLLARKSTLYSALSEIDRDKTLLRQRFEELGQTVTMLKSINVATRAILSVSDTQKVLEQTMIPIVEVFGFDRAIVMLVDERGENLECRYGIGESRDKMSRLKDYRIPLTRNQNLMVRVLKSGTSERVHDVKEAGLNMADRILADFRPTSFIVSPLIAEGRAIGVLGADRRGGKPLTANDEELLSIFANNIAIAFLRARLDEELKSSYVSSVRALVQAIEEKDTYTRGHSERVAQTVAEVAKVLGVPEAEIEYLRLGSILHDVGKIGIPESIMRSPKPLTEAEFRIIQKHPLKGVEILQPISFIKDHLYLVRNHHERWDGRGYPDKLAGDSIPLGAQIVAVADAFDAMTSSRPYRKGLPKEEAVREIRRSTGTQFSQRVSDALILALDRRV